MDAMVRATCPKCRATLRIPTQWVGQTVKCKRCSAVVRSRPRVDPSAAVNGTDEGAPLDQTIPNPPRPIAAPQYGLPQPLAPYPYPQPLPVDLFAVSPGAYAPPGAYPAPPSYPPAAYSAAPSAAHAPEFHPEAEIQPSKRRRPYKRGGGNGKLGWVVVCLVLIGGLGAAAFFAKKHFYDTAPSETADLPPGEVKPGEQPSVQPIKTGPFPRRMLFIHISKYMYLNPLTGGTEDGNDATSAAAKALAFEWNIPYSDKDKANNQLFVLSDTAPPLDPPTSTRDIPMPLKNVVVGAYDQFFETSRRQDRVVVYFGGHAVEKDGKAYLAPMEAELEDANSLIALDDFYAKLNACKATQKVVIWDVCRFNQSRGKQRPGSEPLSESLAKALAAAPPGVEVITTCQPGQNALEFFSFAAADGGQRTGLRLSGSSFLASVRLAGEKRPGGGKQPTASDPIPVADWLPPVARRIADTAGGKQTVKLDGKMKEAQIAANVEEPPAKRFDLPASPRGVSLNEIKAIESEFVVPPITADLKDAGLAELPFREEVMKAYKSDIKADAVLKNRQQFKFQAATLDAFEGIRELWAGTPDMPGKVAERTRRDKVKVPITDADKREINNELEFYAVGIAKLELINESLDQVAADKAGQDKRWQANYEYARAVLKARLAYMNEYNKLMGDVRTETLPALNKAQNHNGYKLAASEKMKSKKDVQKYAEEAQEAYKTLIAEHKDTPWAIQAKRDKSFSLGLTWEPFFNPEYE